ncbi:hypothetical protein ZOD2009_18140 [Haladaptatus paucihalophilus DX253]|uniref:Uncharacterized protein n=1 Tax=Haladaptatus paucihalophilus DX253 TaxID=797209 RepID=E7QXT9_HALPU|nr:hypothetical protein [Haladaptatus paucihalophilus]EFW90640.1 hypothetical protein ZOD2009_18140 [Haladaptatus paucihalophilus DX253]
MVRYVSVGVGFAGENLSSTKWHPSAGVLVGFVAFVPLVFLL